MMLSQFRKKWVLLVLGVIALVPIVITAFEVAISANNSVQFMGNYNPKVAILVISYYVLLFCWGAFWFITQLVAIYKLKNEKVKSELMLLKSQVSPHFFFNILNNLYGLVNKDTQKAQQLILKLADVMRYSIYEGKKESVSLNEEIEYLRNYIALHKMRYHKNILIDFDANIIENHQLVPLLFIMLLENSFKHGVETLRANAYVKVNIISIGNKIQFTVENNYDGTANEKNKTGIGLENLKRRLELSYPNKHQLSFWITPEIYKSQLILEV